jgi:hypothetical protein
MNRNATIIAAILVLLLGVGAFAFLNRNSFNKSDEGSPESAMRTESSSDKSPSNGLKPTRPALRETKEDKATELVEQYGESRTNLSRQIVSNVTSMLDDVLEMGDLMTSGQGGQFGNRGDWAVRAALRGTGVELDGDQKEAVAELYKEFQKRELGKTRAAVQNLKDEPVSLMSLMLASDARSRDEIDEEQYKAVQDTSAGALKDILNPLDRNNFRGGRPMEDAEFRSGFEALLNDDQSSTFTTSMAEQEDSDKDDRKLTNITEIPVMDLESLDKSITSAKQMTSGFKNIMQGMGNLQEIEKQRKGEEGE